MRIVAGSARGRRLFTPDGSATRPTSDRARESIANALGSLDLIVGRTMVDLFCGSGALGIEMLSRGADRLVFVDEDRRAIDAVLANLDATGLGSRAQVIRSDVAGWLDRSDASFDVALVDPPYRFDEWESLLARLPATVAVVESDREIAVADGWRLLRDKRYGSTVVRFLRRDGDSPPAPAPATDVAPAPATDVAPAPEVQAP